MASRSPQFPGARELTILMALEGHEPSPFRTQDGADVFSPSISYFPDGQQIMSGFWDNTVRLWDLRTGKEIEEARIANEELTIMECAQRSIKG